MTAQPNRIEIPAFPGGKRIAVTTSWDDGQVFDRWVVEVLNKLGMKGTFNLNSGWLGRTGGPNPASKGTLDAAEVAALYAGHEVAVHTVTHPSLALLDAAQIVNEVLEDRRALEELVGYPVRGMAYPNGSYDARVIEALRATGIVYSRTTEANVTAFPPSEPLAWATTLHALHGLLERWNAFYPNRWSHGVFYVWGHSYEFENDRDALERLFTPLSGLPDVWYCTNIELFDYAYARHRLVIAANKQSVFNPSAQPVTLRIDGQLHEVPAGLTRLE